MNLTQLELVVVGLIIVYIAFFTNPVPLFLQSLFESPVGHALALCGILYTFVYQSFTIGIFLAIAYVMTTKHVSEHMTDNKKAEAPKQQPTAQKKGTPPPSKVPEVASPKPAHTQTQETFASF
jgi:hypothetical protein